MCVFKYSVYLRPPLSGDDHGRRLKVVMVEGFPLFATMAFVICFVTKEGSSTRIKD